MTVAAGGVTLGVERFGDAAAPLVLLVGGPTMLSWPELGAGTTFAAVLDEALGVERKRIICSAPE